MIKKFTKKPIQLIGILSIIALVVFGYYFMIQEKKKAEERVKSLEKSIDEVKNKEFSEIDEDLENKEIEEPVIEKTETTDEANTQIEKELAITPRKIEQDVPKIEEEKLVSCLAFDGTMFNVSEDECDEIKQKNAIVEKTLDKYEDCLSEAEDDLEEAEEKFQDNLEEGYNSYDASRYNQSVEEYNSDIKICTENRNEILEKLID